MKEKLKSLLVPGIYVVAISAFVFSLYFVQKILSNTLLKDKNLIDTDYVDKEIIKNNKLNKLKKIVGLYSLNNLPIVLSTLKPSR